MVNGLFQCSLGSGGHGGMHLVRWLEFPDRLSSTRSSGCLPRRDTLSLKCQTFCPHHLLGLISLFGSEMTACKLCHIFRKAWRAIVEIKLFLFFYLLHCTPSNLRNIFPPFNLHFPHCLSLSIYGVMIIF